MKSKKITLYIFTIFSISVISRIYAAYFYSDIRLENEWGTLVHNLNITGILGLNVVIDQFTAVHKYASPGDIVLPSVFMPPLYAYFIYVIKLFFNNFFDLVKLVIFIQIFLSLISIYIFFKIVRNFENIKLSLILTSIFSIFPLYVYSSVQISSICIQIFLLLSFFYFLIQYLEKKGTINIFLFSFFSGLLILTRGEFFLFYFLTLVYFFQYIKIDYRSFILSIIITLLVISPYLKRNYNYFEKIVLTKSFGFNLLKGNNPEFLVEGSDSFIDTNFNQKTLKIVTDNNYEIKLDNYYKDQAFTIIKADPLEYFKLYLLKVFSFIFLDLNSSYPGYYNILNILPKIIFAITTLAGAFLALKKKGFFQYLSIYYFLNIALFSAFFILPRYSLILLPVQLLLSIKFFQFIYQKIVESTR